MKVRAQSGYWSVANAGLELSVDAAPEHAVDGTDAGADAVVVVVGVEVEAGMVVETIAVDYNR